MAYDRDPEQPVMDYEVDSFSWEDGLREIEQFDWSKDLDSVSQPENDEQASGEASTANTTTNPMVDAIPNTPGKPPVLTQDLAPKKKVRHSVAESEMDWESVPDAPARGARKSIARQLFPSASSSPNPLASGLGFPSNDFPSIVVKPKMFVPSPPAATHKGDCKVPITDKGKDKVRAADPVEELQYVGPLTWGMRRASSMQSETKTLSTKKRMSMPAKLPQSGQYAGPVTRGMKKNNKTEDDVMMADADEDSEDSY